MSFFELPPIIERMLLISDKISDLNFSVGQVPQVEHPQRDPEVVTGGRHGLGERPDRVVEVGTGVPQRVPHLLRQRPGVDGVVVDQHHVEVGVRREVAAAVPALRYGMPVS